jgi:Asp-tRNA(Asn)/Glu-tRNA(Gln) amidotransferase A subunit family amidase
MTIRSASIGALAGVLLISLASAPVHGQEPGSTFEVHEASIVDLEQALASGRTTSVALVDAYLARIAAYDRAGPALNSVIRLNPAARDDAAALDRERAQRGARGPLHGVPVLVKDNYEVAGLTTSNGSIAFAGWIPKRDADVVRSLREAGAVILGMTNMHELASGITTIASIGGQSRNPYDPTRNPGGSSGGTGAAIAASFAALGWGSDTCGSIRIPAAHQNLFGLRPTKGLFSTEGIFPLSSTQDVPGPLARTVTDLAIGLDATLPPTGQMARGRFRAALDTGALRGLRVGVVRNYFGDAADEQEVARVVRAAIDTIARRGAEVVEITLPDLDSLVNRAGVITQDHKWDMIDFLAARPDSKGYDISQIVDQGLYHMVLQNNLRSKDTVSSRDTEQRRIALRHQEALRKLVLAAADLNQLDVLVYPTIRRKAAIVGEPQPGSTCGLSATTGFPAITMPAGFTPDGLPVGLEAMGRPLTDDRLVAIAYAFERALPTRRAPAFTPPLVAGRAPAPRSVRVEAMGARRERVAGRFTYDGTRGALDYAVQVEGVEPQDILAVTLNQVGQGGTAPVVYRLAPEGAREASGTLVLTYAVRQALLDGRLAMVLYTRAEPAGRIRQTIAFR